jgi:hypothetical protein
MNNFYFRLIIKMACSDSATANMPNSWADAPDNVAYGNNSCYALGISGFSNGVPPPAGSIAVKFPIIELTARVEKLEREIQELKSLLHGPSSCSSSKRRIHADEEPGLITK